MFSFLNNNNVDHIHVNDLDPILDDIQLIDIRENNEYARESIQKSKHIPMDTLLAMPEKYLDKNQKYYIMCQSGMRSQRTASALKKAGFDVVNVMGGIGSYTGKYRK